jgi:hypothetical protein
MKKWDGREPSMDSEADEKRYGPLDPIIEIEYLYGNCPVQAEGWIDGKRFYFRARGEHWRMMIHPTETGDFMTWGKTPAWSYMEPWGDSPFAAGWMPEEIAREMIAKAAEKWRKECGTA